VTGPEPIHLNPATDVADRVLLPGDPQRALAVSQALLEGPKMMNARRGLWGYTGTAPDGGLVTVQSTGMGGPSAAIVAEELIGLGARVLLRIGTCGALTEELSLGDLVVAESALAADGTSRALGAPERIEADPELTTRLGEEARRVTVVSTDVFYETREGIEQEWRAAGAQAVEMESAALFTIARRHGLRAGAVLAVTDVLAGGRERLDQESVDAIGVRLGEAALRALRPR
jgi:DeoD family purine-nucleoside phosphorylase